MKEKIEKLMESRISRKSIFFIVGPFCGIASRGMLQYFMVHIRVNSTQYKCGHSNATIFDITSFLFMNHSKPYIYSDAARYNNCEIRPNFICIYNGAIFLFTLLSGR